MIYVYIGLDLDSLDATVQRQIEELSRRIEDDATSIGLFDRVHPYLKRRVGDYRLIGCLSQFRDASLLCLIAVLHRSDSTYERFLKDPEDRGSPPWADS